MVHLHIQNMAELLAPDNDDLRLRIEQRLAEYWQDKEAFVWTANDIITQAEKDDIEITEDQAHQVLDMMRKRYDSSRGISWDVISMYIQVYS